LRQHCVRLGKAYRNRTIVVEIDKREILPHMELPSNAAAMAYGYGGTIQESMARRDSMYKSPFD